jgi:two-component system OmpR family response regulator
MIATAESPEKPLASGFRILLVEDDPIIGKAVSRGLEDAGHTCTWTKNGKAGLDEGLSQRHDAIVLDLMLPEVTGLEVLRQLRAAGVRAPVVVLTALGSVDDRVSGLREGADDYLVKPFAFPELLARLEAVRRRSADRPAPTLTVGLVTLDLTNRRVTCAGNHVELTPTEFSLLEILMRNAGQVVTRTMLCEHLWEGEWEGVTNVIEVHVNRLRNKLSQAGAEGVIQTIRGRGYALKAA